MKCYQSVLKRGLFAVLTQWFPWQQQLGGQEGVCMSEVTVPIKRTKQKKAHALSLLQNKNIVHDEGNDVMNQLCLGTRHHTALVFLEAMI